MELGTLEYPFRDIYVVINDIFNIYSNTNSTVNVFVMENTDNYLPINDINFINISNVNFDTFTTVNNSLDHTANFIAQDRVFEVGILPKSLLNIIQTFTRGDIVYDYMTSVEADEIVQTSSYVFIINRSSLSFNLINFITDFANVNIEISFIRPVFQYANQISLTNAFYYVQGQTLRNYILSANIYMENITIDAGKAACFMYYSVDCSSPDYDYLAEVVIKNVYAYTSSGEHLRDGLITIEGDPNVTIHNVNETVYKSVGFLGFTISYHDNPYCVTLDDVLQIIDFQNFYSTLKVNPGGDFNSVIGVWIHHDSTRYYKVYYANFLFTERYKDALYIFGVYGRFYEEVLYENITISYSEVTARPFF